MTDQERAVMQQALEALERGMFHRELIPLREKAITALRAALAQQPEPVCKCDLRTRLVGDGCEVCNPELAAELAQKPEPAQEPVAWDGRCMLGHCNSPAGCENSGECRAIERKVRGE